MSSCNGKTALVTDCASGEIGRMAAVALAEEGAQVLLHSRRPSTKVNVIVEKICAAGGRARAIVGDITTTHGPHQLAQDARAIIGDRLDILVINFGPLKPSTVETATVQEFDTQFAANIRAPFFLIQQLLPIMRQGSCVIFTGPPQIPWEESQARYSSADGSIHNLVNHFSASLAARRIRVNAIMLETVKSDVESTDQHKQTDGVSKRSTRTTPARGVGGAIAALVSGGADWINGQTLQFNR